jgi:hypothetical protein
MHTPTHWFHTDLLNLPSISLEELEEMIAAQSIAPPRQGTGRKRREQRTNRPHR